MKTIYIIILTTVLLYIVYNTLSTKPDVFDDSFKNTKVMSTIKSNLSNKNQSNTEIISLILDNPVDECKRVGGTWKEFPDDCIDFCHFKSQPTTWGCGEAITEGCDCGTDICWTGKTCISNKQWIEERACKSDKDCSEGYNCGDFGGENWFCYPKFKRWYEG